MTTIEMPFLPKTPSQQPPSGRGWTGQQISVAEPFRQDGQARKGRAPPLRDGFGQQRRVRTSFGGGGGCGVSPWELVCSATGAVHSLGAQHPSRVDARGARKCRRCNMPGNLNDPAFEQGKTTFPLPPRSSPRPAVLPRTTRKCSCRRRGGKNLERANTS
jgi:hypothetical protein